MRKQSEGAAEGDEEKRPETEEASMPIGAKRPRDADAQEATATAAEGGNSSLFEYALGGGGGGVPDAHAGEHGDGDEGSSSSHLREDSTSTGGGDSINGRRRGEAVYGDDGELQVLGARQLEALRENRRVRDMLRTRELRGMIKIIDKSRSRIDALEAAIHNSGDFSDFCDMLLGIIYQNS